MRKRIGIALLPVLALVCGCGSFNGPGIEFTAPRVTGRVLSDATGAPLANVRVGRELYTWKQPDGGLWKGAEELKMLQRETRTGADGSFELASERVALLFSFGDIGFNLRLIVQATGRQRWQTNYSFKALSTNATAAEPLLEAGEIRLTPR